MLIAILVSFLAVFAGSLVWVGLRIKRGMRPAKAFCIQFVLFMVLMPTCLGTCIAAESATSSKSATTQTADKAEPTAKEMSDAEAKASSWKDMAAAIVGSVACIGSAIAVAAAAPAAIGAISEDKTILGKVIGIVGLAEGVAVFGLIIAVIIKLM